MDCSLLTHVAMAIVIVFETLTSKEDHTSLWYVDAKIVDSGDICPVQTDEYPETW